jgi:hypothetical protein
MKSTNAYEVLRVTLTEMMYQHEPDWRCPSLVYHGSFIVIRVEASLLN